MPIDQPPAILSRSRSKRTDGIRRSRTGCGKNRREVTRAPNRNATSDVTIATHRSRASSRQPVDKEGNGARESSRTKRVPRRVSARFVAANSRGFGKVVVIRRRQRGSASAGPENDVERRQRHRDEKPKRKGNVSI